MQEQKQQRLRSDLFGNSGFTLLEMSIVLLVISVVVAGTVSMGSSMVAVAQLGSTRNKLDTIETALLAYRVANNRLPCPADPALTDIAANSATYGFETGAAGTCGGGSTTSYTVPSPSSNTNVASTGTVVEGTIPVRTLGLSDEFQFDGWGRKISYAVWTPLTVKASATSSAAFINYGVTPSCGAITVKNAGHGNRSTAAAYALISYGPDGHGGYTKAGTRYNAGVSNLDEVANAHYSSLGVDTGLYAATYVEKDYSTYAGDADAAHPFGHLVRFKERWQMQNAYDTYYPQGLSCSPGFHIDGATAGDKSGYAVAVGDINGDGIPDIIIGAPAAVYGSGCPGYACGSVYVVFGTRNGFPDPLPLSSLNGTNGFRLDGPSRSVWAGTGSSVAVGDVNGDGVADIIIGAYQAYYGNTAANNGSVYVVFGGSCPKSGCINGGWPASATLTTTGGTLATNWLGNGTTNAVNGFRLDGGYTTPGERFGENVTAADVNGDGIPDIIVEAQLAAINGAQAGAIYVIYGGPGPKSGGSWPVIQPVTGNANGSITFALNTTPTNGQSIVLNGVTWTFKTTCDAPSCTANNETQISVTAPTYATTLNQLVTDLNSSANASLTVAKYAQIDPAGHPYNNVLDIAAIGTTGTSYTLCSAGACNGSNVYNGDANATASGTALANANWLGNGTNNAVNGFRIDGITANDQLGTFGLATGDVNGDGIADIVTSAIYRSPSTVYVIYGATGAKKKNGTPWAVSQTIAPDGINIASFTDGIGNDFGTSIAIGDVNGDGIADIVASSIECVTFNTSCGTYYVIFGNGHGWGATTAVSTFTGTAGITNMPSTGGVKIRLGLSPTANAPSHLAVGDVNGDGIVDIIAAFYGQSPGGVSNAGSAYVLFGTSGTWTTPMDVTFNGINGFELDGGYASELLGYYKMAIGDVNGDGVGDIILNAFQASPNGNSQAGVTYVYFGHKHGGWPTTPFSLGGL